MKNWCLNLKYLHGCVLFILMFVCSITKVNAEIREGVVVGRQPAGANQVRILIKVDRNSPRPFDYTIDLFSVNRVNLPGATLSMMLIDGTVIRFDDSNMEIRNGIKMGNHEHLLYIGDNSVLDILPEWGERAFPYAEIHRRRTQSEQ